MGLPSKKRTKRSQRDRRSHFALKPIAISVDEDGNPHLAHQTAPASGKYRGRNVVAVEKRAARTARNKRTA